jgi:sugar phosphate isomerase/epimerase
MGIREAGAVRARFPFRLGTTSYIIPDDILPNVRYLVGKVDDIQLILFESDEISNLPPRHVVKELAAIGQGENLTYTVHFPLDVWLGAADELERLQSVDKCRRIIDLCHRLDVRTYALHLAPAEPDDRGELPAADMPVWEKACGRSLAALCAELESSRQLCVETLAYRFDVVDGLLEAHDLGVCLDIGHLLLGGRDVEAHLETYADRLHLMHIHGVREGRDHQSLRHLDEALLAAAVRQMSDTAVQPRVMTVEVFSEADFLESMEVLVDQQS